MARIVIDARGIRNTSGRYYGSLLDAMQQLVDRQHEYHVIIHQSDQGHWAPKSKNFYLHIVTYKHYTFGEQLGFARFLYKLKPDLVHFCFPQQPLLYFGKRITNIYDLTLVRFKNVDKNRLIYWLEQQIFIFLLKNVSRRSRYIIVDSNYVKQDVADFTGVNPKKIKVVYGAALDKEQVKPQAIASLKGADFLLYVGNAFPHKNLRRLADAHARLRNKYPSLKLVVAGRKEYFHEQFADYVENQGYEGVTQVGYVSDEQLVWLYKRAAAYVFPSLSEGFGLPGLEVMQHATPLVASKTTALPEVYGEAAHYFDPLSIDDMERAIDEVLRSKARRQKLIQAGQERLRRYSWGQSAKIVLRAYRHSLD